MSGYNIPRIWRAKQYKGVEITRCLHCDSVSLGHRPICPNCGDEIKVRFGVKLSDEKALDTSDNGNIFASIDFNSRVVADK